MNKQDVNVNEDENLKSRQDLKVRPDNLLHHVQLVLVHHVLLLQHIWQWQQLGLVLGLLHRHVLDHAGELPVLDRKELRLEPLLGLGEVSGVCSSLASASDIPPSRKGKINSMLSPISWSWIVGILPMAWSGLAEILRS